MMNRKFIAIIMLMGFMSCTPAVAEPPSADRFSTAPFSSRVVTGLGTTVAKAVLKYFGKEGAQEATEYLSKQGGEEIVKRVTAAAAKQGGDQAVAQVAKIVSKHGPDAVAALDNAPSILPLLRAIDEIPESQVKTVLARLAAGKAGRELAETTTRFGVKALQAELKHPGVGGVLVRSLGDDGAELAAELSTDQAIAIARHCDDVAKLPVSQRTGILNLIRTDGERFFKFVGRFVENNPGKTLFTAATTTVILTESERMLGGDEIVYDADGNPILISKPGVVGRVPAIAGEMAGDVASHVTRRYLQPLFYALMAFGVVFASIYTWRKLPTNTTN